jgi:hypothetical protein
MGAANAGMLVRGAMIRGMRYTLYPHTGVRLLRNPGATTRSRKSCIIATKLFTGTQTERIGHKTYRVTDVVDTSGK